MSSLDTAREKSCNLDYDGVGVEQATQVQGRPAGGGSQAKALTFELVSQHFSMPIKQAAQELNVGVTVLKKRCREVGIPRWPHRKVKCLKTLIDNIQEFGKETQEVDVHLIRIVVERLQQTKKLIEERPEVPLDEKTKQLGQACHNLNWRRKKRGSRANTARRD